MTPELNLSARHYVILRALRNQATLVRKPTVLTPDGHERWYSLAELQESDGLDDMPLASLDPAARTMRARHIILARTIQGRTRFAITDEGMALLDQVEHAAGVAEGIAADLAYGQAVQRVKALQAEIQAAHETAAAALEELCEQRDRLGYPTGTDIVTRAKAVV
jgi:hypothetical protein